MFLQLIQPSINDCKNLVAYRIYKFPYTDRVWIADCRQFWRYNEFEYPLRY